MCGPLQQIEVITILGIVVTQEIQAKIIPFHVRNLTFQLMEPGGVHRRETN